MAFLRLLPGLLTAAASVAPPVAVLPAAAPVLPQALRGSGPTPQALGAGAAAPLTSAATFAAPQVPRVGASTPSVPIGVETAEAQLMQSLATTDQNIANTGYAIPTPAQQVETRDSGATDAVNESPLNVWSASLGALMLAGFAAGTAIRRWRAPAATDKTGTELGTVGPKFAAAAFASTATSQAAPSFCGASCPQKPADASGKTAARYTTQTILPALQWIKTGLKGGDLQPTELRAKNLAGVDVLIGKDGSGKLFAVGNLCPHIGTPLSEGADVIGDAIVCPLHGSSWKVTTGELIDWCPSPPIVGPLTGLIVEKKNLAIFEVQSSFFGGDIEVLIDTNAKKAYEADYWKGILDAQGKDDGTYY